MPKVILEKIACVVFDRAKAPLDVLTRFSNMKCGPLHLACLTGNIGAVNMLLAHGAKADSQANHWRKLTPLHCAAATALLPS